MGCLCYAVNHHTHGDKFDTRSIKSVLMGYSTTQKGYKLYDLSTQTFFISRDVTLREDQYPFQHIQDESCDSSFFENSDMFVYDDSPTIPLHEASITSPDQTSKTIDSSPSPISQPFDTSTTTDLRRSTRYSKPPGWLHDFVHTATHSPTHSPTCSTAHPLSSYMSYYSISTPYFQSLCNFSAIPEPTSYNEAVQHSHWIQAMELELKTLHDNHTWDLVPLPLGKKAMGCKWVYKVKFNAQGEVERYKTRLIAKGYTQQEGLDYQETFSPVVKMVTVRVVLSLAAMHGWFLHQMDVFNAFLQGDLVEEVYMVPPPGFLQQGESKVCKLNK